MRTFEVVAGVGVPPIRLGMTHDEVREAMGEPEGGALPEPAWEYFDSALLVNFEDGRVEYLEVANGPDSGATFEGRAIFEIPMDEAARLVSVTGVHTKHQCANPDTDVGMYSSDGERWDAIGVGSGNHFRRQP